MDTLSFEQFLLVAAIVFAGALVFCMVGFGIGVASFPLLLLLLDPQTAVVVINTVSLFMFALVIWQTRRHIPVRHMLPIAAAGLVGVPVGVFILRDADAAVLRIAIAALIIALTLLAAFNTRWTLPKSTPVGMGAGFVVSVMLNAFGVGGALMALALLSRRLSPHALRGSLSLYFIVVEGAGVIGYGAGGLLTQERLLLIGVAALPVMLGFGLATLILRRINEVMFRRLVIVAIVVTSMMVLVREVARHLIEIGWLEAVVSALALFLASIVFSATGFGIGMISTPLMLLVYEPQTVIVVAATAGLGVGIWIITKSWRDIPFREILPVAIAALFGAPIAVFILNTADSSILSIGIAVLIILFAVASVSNFQPDIKHLRELGITIDLSQKKALWISYLTILGVAIGFIVGVLLPTSGVAGSLVMLFLMTKNWQRQTVRAAMAFFLVSLMSFSIILFALWGLYTPLTLTLIGVVAIPTVIGLAIGAMLVNRLNERAFQYIVIGIIIVSSVLVLAKEASKYL